MRSWHGSFVNSLGLCSKQYKSLTESHLKAVLFGSTLILHLSLSMSLAFHLGLSFRVHLSIHGQRVSKAIWSCSTSVLLANWDSSKQGACLRYSFYGLCVDGLLSLLYLFIKKVEPLMIVRKIMTVHCGSIKKCLSKWAILWASGCATYTNPRIIPQFKLPVAAGGEYFVKRGQRTPYVILYICVC